MSEYEDIIFNRQVETEVLRQDVAREQMRPFYLLRPRMFQDGDQWCVLYGDNLQDGVAAFGDTPAKAATQFDLEWLNRKLANKGVTGADEGGAP